MKAAYSFVLNAAAKIIPVRMKILNECLRMAIMPTKREKRLKKRHSVSMRKLLDRIRCQGLKAKRRAAESPVVLSYATLPIPYTKTTHPRPNKVTRKVPLMIDAPKVLKRTA